MRKLLCLIQVDLPLFLVVILVSGNGFASTNLALTGTATQSSTAFSGAPERAIDGNTSGVYSDGSVTHTSQESKPYWDLDLGSIVNIDTIKIYNRTDGCCSHRLKNFYVFVSDVPFVDTNHDHVRDQSGVQSTLYSGTAPAQLDFPINRTGRYVRIHHKGSNNFLSLAEVQVIGDDQNPMAELPLSVQASVDPNVMLLIDTSGSMHNVIWHEDYDPTTTYDNWLDFTSEYSNYSPPYNTTTHKNARLSNIRLYMLSECSTNNYFYGVRNGIGKCIKLPDPVGDEKTIYIRNYLNYLFTTYDDDDDLSTVIPNDLRMDVAIDVSKDIVNETNGVRFGVSRFFAGYDDDDNSGRGGTISQGCTNNKSLVIDKIDTYAPDNNTPLAEAFYEITRYFRGMSSYYHTNTTYQSPIEYRCQKNFAIVLTDGLPTRDQQFPANDQDDPNGLLPNWDGLAPATADVITQIYPQYSDGHGAGFGGREAETLYLDDMAKFAYDIDMRKTGNDEEGESFNDLDFPKQNLETYTVGFSLNVQMLRDAAEYGHGAYYSANNGNQLRAALQSAINDVKNKTSNTAAPVATSSFKLFGGHKTFSIELQQRKLDRGFKSLRD